MGARQNEIHQGKREVARRNVRRQLRAPDVAQRIPDARVFVETTEQPINQWMVVELLYNVVVGAFHQPSALPRNQQLANPPLQIDGAFLESYFNNLVRRRADEAEQQVHEDYADRYIKNLRIEHDTVRTEQLAWTHCLLRKPARKRTPRTKTNDLKAALV